MADDVAQPDPSPPPPAPGLLRRAGVAAGFAALAASVVLATDMFGARQAVFGSATAPARATAFSRVVTEAPGQQARTSVLRSQPWWQDVGTLSGSGSRTVPRPAVGAGAIQWRMKWSCETGRFAVADGAKRLIDAACPAAKTKELVAKPSGPLSITADGPWRMGVEQQVDVPLNEPPLAAMRAAGTREVATGRFYRMDQVGRGKITFYRLPDGRRAVRLDDFYVTPNVDLEIRLTSLRRPRTTAQYLKSRSILVAPLDVTTGSMNFIVPRGVDPADYRSVVIWCENVISAYAAATLQPGAS